MNTLSEIVLTNSGGLVQSLLYVLLVGICVALVWWGLVNGSSRNWERQAS